MRRSTAATTFVILLGLTAIVAWSALRQANRLVAVEAQLDAVQGRVAELTHEITSIQGRLDVSETSRSAQMSNTAEERQTVSLPLFYIRTTEHGTDYEVVGVRRQVAKLQSKPEQIQAVFSALLAGPTPSEVEAHDNLSNLIPEGTTLLGVQIDDETAILNLSREFERVGGTARIDGMLQQLTYTVTAFEGIHAVRILIDGERVGTASRPFTGDGFLFDALRREMPLISSVAAPASD